MSRGVLGAATLRIHAHISALARIVAHRRASVAIPACAFLRIVVHRCALSGLDSNYENELWGFTNYLHFCAFLRINSHHPIHSQSSSQA